MSFYAVSALLNAVTSFILGTLLLTKNKGNKLFFVFSLFSYSVAVWSIFYFLWQTATGYSEAVLYTRAFMAAAVFIPFFYFHFVTIFTKTESSHKAAVISGYLFAVIFSALSFTDLFITDVVAKSVFQYWPTYGPLFNFFIVTWIAYAFGSVYLLLQARKDASSKLKKQVNYILLGTVVGYLGGISNYFLWYDINIPPYGNGLATFYVVIISYAIIKYQLFNLKVVIAEFIVFTLWILASVRLALSENDTDVIYNGFYLFAVILIGVFLIYNVRKEVSARLEIQGLAKKLEKTNKRLRALDKQKSEFVSIASHQLRSPLTAIRGYATMLNEGSFGKIPKKAKEPLERIAESTRLMALAIEDYLSVSRIESGNMKYEYTVFDLPKRVEQVCDDLRKEAVKKGLLLTYKSKLESEGHVCADEGKVQQILHNIINNSLKYTEKGSVTVCVTDQVKENIINIDVVDTGIGMSGDTLSAIFQKFQRAKNANSVNVHGTGLGLFVARKMAEDMNGKICASSPGEGKGSHFTICLPLAENKKESGKTS